MSLTALAANAAIKLNETTHQTIALPLVIFFPTARCNSRCVSCDWWRADGASDLTLDEIRRLAAELPELHTRVVLFSGGEPLLRREVFEIADLFRSQGMKLHLLTSGLGLDKSAEQIAARFEQVTISLDGYTRDQYQRIRGVDGLASVERGVAHLHQLAPTLPIRARSTLHRHNYEELPHLIDKAHAMGLTQISFLAADVTSEAFGYHGEGSRAGLLLDKAEVGKFGRVVEEAIISHAREFQTHFVAESPDKLRRLPRYYAAQLGEEPFPSVACNAPWASAVIEADGAVRPCFFHRTIGNVREHSLKSILRGAMVAFRRGLDVSADETCRKCVCSLKVGWRSRLWP